MEKGPDHKATHIYTKLKSVASDIPPPLEHENDLAYIERLASIPEVAPYIITQKELSGLVPQGLEKQDKKENWQDKETGLRELLKKVKSGKVMFIQTQDGKIHDRGFLSTLSPAALKVYQKTTDYSLALVLGNIVEKSLADMKVELKSDDYNAIVDALVEEVSLLSEDPTLFREGLLTVFTSEEFLKKVTITPESLTAITNQIVSKFALDGMRRIREIDSTFMPPRKGESIPGVEIRRASTSDKKSAGVLITTSSGGGCHKNIANQSAIALNSRGIDCAIINETDLTMVDPLYQFLGIPVSILYPMVFQQCGKAECREILKEISSELTSGFLPLLEFAQLRDAVRYCEEAFPEKEVVFDRVFSTQHYSNDLRAIPKGSTIAFQVCDFGHISHLAELAKVVGNIPQNDQVKFLIPSTSCLTPISSALKSGADPDTFVNTIYPTLILPKDEAERRFAEFVKNNGLYPPDEPDVLRATILMGGQGCADLIMIYLNKIISEMKGNTTDKMELVVVCGNNPNLVTQLQKDYLAIAAAVAPNLKLTILGRVDNPDLIAYNKKSVLITKPGGGTISESVQNGIQTLVHYDDKFWWEEGNAREVRLAGLGKIVSGRLKDEPEIKLEEQNLLAEIKTATAKRKTLEKNNQKSEVEFQSEITRFMTLINEKLISESGFTGRAKVKDIDANAHLATIYDALKALIGKYPKDKESLMDLYTLQQILRKNPSNKDPILVELKDFVNKFSPKTTAEKILTSTSKRTR